MITVVEFINAVMHRDRRAAPMARRATETYPSVRCKERNAASGDGSAVECHRIYEFDHKAAGGFHVCVASLALLDRHSFARNPDSRQLGGRIEGLAPVHSLANSWRHGRFVRAAAIQFAGPRRDPRGGVQPDT